MDLGIRVPKSSIRKEEELISLLRFSAVLHKTECSHIALLSFRTKVRISSEFAGSRLHAFLPPDNGNPFAHKGPTGIYCFEICFFYEIH